MLNSISKHLLIHIKLHNIIILYINTYSMIIILNDFIYII
jgi:hypothetical protein